MPIERETERSAELVGYTDISSPREGCLLKMARWSLAIYLYLAPQGSIDYRNFNVNQIPPRYDYSINRWPSTEEDRAGFWKAYERHIATFTPTPTPTETPTATPTSTPTAEPTATVNIIQAAYNPNTNNIYYLFETEAAAWGWSRDRIARGKKLINCESEGNPNARSKNGKYYGYFQFDDNTFTEAKKAYAEDFIKRTGKSPDHQLNINDPRDQMTAFFALVRKEGYDSITRRWPACGWEAFRN